MRNGPHVDRRKYRLAQVAPVEQGFASSHGLVVSHVLVDGKRDAGALAQADDLARLGVIHAQRLLGQDSADVLLSLDDLSDDVDLRVRRHGDVDHLDLRIVQQLFVRVVRLADVVPLGHRAGTLRIPRGDRHRIETSIAVRHQVAVGHDESGADATNTETLVTR